MFNALYCREKALHDMCSTYGRRFRSVRKRYRKAQIDHACERIIRSTDGKSREVVKKDVYRQEEE